jgi:hypothetical protein
MPRAPHAVAGDAEEHAEQYGVVDAVHEYTSISVESSAIQSTKQPTTTT